MKYVLRPPIAGEHLQPGSDGRIRIELKRPFRDGTRAIELDPLALLYRLAAAVPAPRFHTVRYSGVLGSASPWRSEVIPAPKSPPQEAPATGETGDRAPTGGDPPSSPRGGFRSRYRGWAEMIERAFAVNPRVCPACGGPMRLVALVKDAESVARFLRHQGEPTEPPRRAPARGPPYDRSPSIRHREPSAPDLFDM